MSNKLTSLEKKWAMYDVANSAFTLMVSTIIPIYFHQLGNAGGVAEADYLAYWAYSLSISTLLVALLGPFIGAIADKGRKKKEVFFLTILLGSIGCLALGFIRQWLVFLVVFCIAKSIYSVSLVVYDSTLGDVTTEDRMDNVSSAGYAWGYIGSCVPFVLCLVLVLAHDKVGIDQMTALSLAFVITALWWFFISMPLMRVYQQKNYISDADEAQKGIFTQLGTSLKHIAKDKKVVLFLLAFFFYIDGVYTIIDMSTAYGSALGLDSTHMLLALLLTQVVAFPSVMLVGKLSQTHKSSSIIKVCIAAYFCISVFAFFMAHAWQFWVLAEAVGMILGRILAMSLSYFTKITPAERSGEYFGFYDICGKGASIIGTTMMGFLAQITGKANYGVVGIAVFFLAGFFLFRASVKEA